jgi:hypothetical protein
MSTPLNEAAVYPITSYDQTSDLLKQRVQQIRDAMAKVYGVSECEMWLYGSQVTGKRFLTNTPAINPDIDVRIHHPCLSSDWLPVKGRLHEVAKLLNFDMTIALVHTLDDCCKMNAIKIDY